jgi:UDP-2,3-diacylglucosamine pyrophosphatase LpxH
MSKDTYIVSDFHLGMGRNSETGKFSRNEEFFYDVEFSLFIDHILKESKEKNSDILLILNGDILDYLAVTSLPSKQEIKDLNLKITKNELKFGLGSSENKACWKTRVIIKGHPIFFETLARFLLSGNEIIYIKGNHDLELYWKKVRKIIKDHLIFLLKKLNSPNQDEIKKFSIRPWFYMEDKKFYVEHGNEYDTTNSLTTPLNPLLPENSYKIRERLLDYPVGSLFARYVYGPIRQLDPYRTHVISFAQYLTVLRTYNIWDFLRTLYFNFPFFIRASKNSISFSSDGFKNVIKKHEDRKERFAKDNGISNKNLKKLDNLRVRPLGHSAYEIFKQMFQPFIKQTIILGTVSVISIYAWILIFTVLSSLLQRSIFGKASLIAILGVLTVVGVFFILTKIGKALNNYEDPLIARTFEKSEKISRIMDVENIVMGHTHIPEKRKLKNGGYYINSGTWTLNPGPWDQLQNGARQYTYVAHIDGKIDLYKWDPVLKLSVSPIILDNHENSWEKVMSEDFIPSDE